MLARSLSLTKIYAPYASDKYAIPEGFEGYIYVTVTSVIYTVSIHAVFGLLITAFSKT